MSLKEANRLIKKYVKLRDQVKNSASEKLVADFKKHENLCIQKFRYLVLMKTSRYKNFNNYEDLNQEGLEALVMAMNSYKPERGNWFWWAHKYLDTRIARCANRHTTIRFPLKYAKNTTPHREAVLPLLIDNYSSPYDAFEYNETIAVVQKSFDKLSDSQQQVIKLLFGMNGEDPQSISRVCKKLKISRPYCINVLDQVFSILKRSIQL